MALAKRKIDEEKLANQKIANQKIANQQRVIKNATRRNHGKSVGNARSALAKAFGWK